MYYLGGRIALWGCEKIAPKELSPKAEQPAQASATAKAAWLRFVDRVERGEIVDPSGQYVAKKTIVTDHRLSRPTFDAATPAFAQHYRLGKNGEIMTVPVSNKGGVTTNLYLCPECDNGGGDGTIGGGGGLGPPVPTFISTEGKVPYNGSDNPQGYLYDLKLIVSTTGDAPVARVGYTILYPDLNRGAGGHTIYLTYTRNPSQVLYGAERGRANSVGPVTAIDTKTINPILYISPPNPPGPYSWPIWNSGGPNQQYGLTEVDLNEGAGGDYIYSYQLKESGQVPIEVGVIYGETSSIQPPSGWSRNGVNLNKGAGGAYIYLCFKNR